MGLRKRTESTGLILPDRYQVQNVLAEGGMSVLVAAVDTHTGRPVAIKSMRPHEFRSAERRKRFEQEIQTARSLQHPNIVQVLDSGYAEGGAPYLAMELLHGHSLEDELKTRGQLPVRRALGLLLPVLGALAHAHKHGVVHRDIKPANIFLTEKDSGQVTPKLLDFGISIVRDGTRLTDSGVVVGTVRYMSPEQARDAEVGPAADIWATGVVLYHCLTGRVPFDADVAASLLVKILSQPAPRLASTMADVGPRTAAAIDRALRKEPESRYQDMEGFAKALCLSARSDGIEIPESPDPIGLPDWPGWRTCEMPQDYVTAVIEPAGSTPLSSYPPPTTGASTQFVGREGELKQIQGALQHARTGSGQAVGIVGDPGVGKSRLVLEMKSLLDTDEHHYLEGRCLQYGRSINYLPVLQLLRGFFHLSEGDDIGEARVKLRQRLLSLDKQLVTVISPLEELLSLKAEDDDHELRQLDPPQRLERAFEATAFLLSRVAEDKPLVLVIEDLHWVDQVSEMFFAYLIDRLPRTRILLLLLFRPEYAHQWSTKDHFTEIALQRLDTGISTQLLHSIMQGGDISAELQELVLSRAGGNPLFIEELVRALLESGCIQRRGDQFGLQVDHASVQLPNTLHGIIGTRLNLLEERLKQTVQMASVVGADVTFAVLKAITGMQEELQSHLADLQKHEFIRERSLLDRPGFVFRHPITREVAYDSLLDEKKKEAHDKAGDAIEALYAERLDDFYEMLAHHYTNAENWQKAWHYLKLSGEKAASVFSSQEAANLLTQALHALGRLPPSDDNKRAEIDIRGQLDIHLSFLGYTEGSLENLAQKARLSKELGDSASLAASYSRMTLYYVLKGDPALGREYAERALEEAKRAENVELTASITAHLCETYGASGEHAKIADLAPGVIALFAETQKKSLFFDQPLNLYSWLCARAGVAMGALGNFRQGTAFCEKALSNALEVGHLPSVAGSEMSYAGFSSFMGDGKAAVAHAQKAVHALEQLNWSWALSTALSSLGIGYFFRGDLVAARSHLERACELQSDFGVSFSQAAPYSALCMVCLDLGNISEARSHAEKALQIARDAGDRLAEGMAWVLRGRALTRGDGSEWEEAEQNILRGIGILQSLQLRPLVAGGHLGLGELYVAWQRTEEALDNLEKARHMFEELGMPFWPEKAREALATAGKA